MSIQRNCFPFKKRRHIVGCIVKQYDENGRRLPDAVYSWRGFESLMKVAWSKLKHVTWLAKNAAHSLSLDWGVRARTKSEARALWKKELGVKRLPREVAIWSVPDSAATAVK